MVSSEGAQISVEEDDRLHAGPHREARCKVYDSNVTQSPEKVQNAVQLCTA